MSFGSGLGSGDAHPTNGFAFKIPIDGLNAFLGVSCQQSLETQMFNCII